MQNKKNIIIIAVIALIVIVVVVVLIRRMGNPAANSDVQNPISESAISTEKTSILPHGNQLNFEAIKKYNPDGKLFNYPSVGPEQVGTNVADILKKVQPTSQ